LTDFNLNNQVRTTTFLNAIYMFIKSKPAASSSKALPVKKLVQDAVSAAEIASLLGDGYTGMVTVLGKFQVTPMMYHLVAGQLESIHLNLIEGVEYTAAELVGDSWWSYFDHAGKREMELCIKHFAANPAAKLIDTDLGTFELAAG
jgi:hypothetical protein